MKKFLLALLCVTLCACARPAPPVLPPEDGDALWEKMAAFHGPDTCKMQFSMRFGAEGDTRRVTGLLWGDEERLRLDIMAGVGAPIAKILLSGQDFLLYLPQKQVSYAHSGPPSPWFRLGVPIPLDLRQLADLMNGDFGAVFQRDGQGQPGDGGYTYPVSGHVPGELTLDAAARPIAWRAAKGGWRLTVGYDGDGREPASLRLANTNGKRAIILIKERDAHPAFLPEQLTLAIPAGTREESLANLKQGMAF